MRRLILVGLLAAIALPAVAAKRVTVAQLEQALTAAVTAHKPEAEIIRMIGGLELTERLSETTLNRLDTSLDADPQEALAMQLLADQSAFLNLPAGESPATPAPDEASQLQMMNAAGKYVAETLLRLPNFLATRKTNRFDDSPQEVQKGAWPVRAGLHLVDRSTRESSVSAERDSESPAKASALSQGNGGLTSWGEFGSVLGMILSDVVNGTVSWSHWEQTPERQLAVFHFSVPKTASHFEIVSSNERQASIEGFAAPIGRSRVSGIATKPTEPPFPTSTSRASRGYQGSLWLDPATGTIFRITIEVDAKGQSTFQRVAMLVEYGPEEVGGSAFICPVRSLAFSTAAGGGDLDPVTRTPGKAPTMWLNETFFSDYHRFAGTTRILSSDDATAPVHPPGSTPAPQ